MKKPSFGVELHQYLDTKTVLAEAQLAERLGYASVWFADSQLIWRELYVLLGAAAATTSRVALGTGVTNPVTRHPAVTASAIATAQELSGGRALLGISVGNTSLTSMGMKPATRAELASYVGTVRALCRGEVVKGPSGEVRLAYASGVCPPIVVGASGPKMLRLAGQMGDGVIITRQARAGATLAAMMQCVREGRAQAGGGDGPFLTCLSAAVAVHSDRGTALRAVRPHVASGLQHVRWWGLSEAAREASDRLQEVYDVYEHMSPGARHAELIPEEVISEFAIAGTPEECVEQARGLFEAGIDEITIRPYGVDGGSRADMIAIFAEQVLAALA